MKSDKHITHNLYEAAYLMAKGFDLVGKTQEGRKVVVGFSGEGVQKASLDFYNGGKIGAKAYSDSYRTLKDYVFEG